MMDLEFSFEAAPWEIWLRQVPSGGRVPAVTLLTLMEGQDESALADCLQALEDREISLDLEGLPKPTGSGEAAVRLRQEEQLVARGLSHEELEEGDPLRLYLEELAMTPAFGDMELLAQDSRDGDENARILLTNLCLSQVVERAGAHAGMGVLLLDLIQEGSLGLWQAIGSWQRGAFGPYARKWIDFYMARAVLLQAHCNGVGQHLRSALEDYRGVDERLLAELGRNPTPEEIAEAMHITPEVAISIAAMMDNARSLARTMKQPEPEEETQVETQAVEDTAYFQMRQRIGELLSTLSPEDARLITLRYGLEGGLPLSPEEAGRRMGLTPQEVLAREAAALSMLRTV